MTFDFNGFVFDTDKPIYVMGHKYKSNDWFPYLKGVFQNDTLFNEISSAKFLVNNNYGGDYRSVKKCFIKEIKFKTVNKERVVSEVYLETTGYCYNMPASKLGFFDISAQKCHKKLEDFMCLHHLTD